MEYVAHTGVPESLELHDRSSDAATSTLNSAAHTTSTLCHYPRSENPVSTLSFHTTI